MTPSGIEPATFRLGGAVPQPTAQPRTPFQYPVQPEFVLNNDTTRGSARGCLRILGDLTLLPPSHASKHGALLTITRNDIQF